MAKKIKPCPSWMGTFADLMSLLMAIFVLLFAMSTMDARKFEDIARSLTNALGFDRDLSPVQEASFKSMEAAREAAELELLGETMIEDLKPLYESLLETYATKEHDKDIQINFDPDKNQIKVTFSENIAFGKGSSDLKPSLIFQLRKLKIYITPEIMVKAVGHTDKVPMGIGGRYISNWELSSSRASKVITQLIRDGIISPEQAIAVGMAETQPLTLETTPEAHAKNRRVDILLKPL